MRSLSPREREVLTLLARGCVQKEAARRMHVSARTVKATLATAREKLDAPTTTAAVAWALAEGIIALTDRPALAVMR